ncbi:MAG: hypothetical protein COY80_00080 [Candidatus Pacebacteria bacterium CG_4_10_14_0_8_um_filter_42_14]|nr:MAG: hypothetical protein COY80_00080 [Candidatus Pacebacteria bacterium CG_4_10_14_0_8_um_filter_42_14]
MKKDQLFSFLYALGKITLGLLLHPYQTMQSLIRERAFIWMALLPSAVFVGAKIIWFFVLVPMVRFAFSCSVSSFFGCELIPFFANWLVLFCIYWQVMLLYLLLRFSLAFRD